MAALLVERATHPDGPPFWGPYPKRELLVSSPLDGGPLPLLSLTVEHLKVMAALTVEPAYASSPLGSSTSPY